MYASSNGFWRRFAGKIRSEPPRQKVKVLKRYGVPPPKDAGATRSLGLGMFNPGQRADWRWTFTDDASLHVEEYDDHYLAHWDEVDPHKNPVGHLFRDAPGLVIVGLLAAVGLPLLIDALSD